MRWVGLCCPNKTKRDKRKFWTKEEDQIVSIMQEKLGNRWVEIEIGNRWVEISRLLPGRTYSAVANRWHKIAKRAK